MNAEQVSALSDVELNRAMIWFYPPTDSVAYNGAIDMYTARYRSMDYLTSYDLTMPLAVENKISLTPVDFSCWMASPKGSFIATMSQNPLRAICEVLVLLKVNC